MNIPIKHLQTPHKKQVVSLCYQSNEITEIESSLLEKKAMIKKERDEIDLIRSGNGTEEKEDSAQGSNDSSSDDYEVYDYDWVYSFMDDAGVNEEQENENEESPKAYAAPASESGNKSTVQSSSGDQEKFDPFKDDAVNEDDMATTIAFAQEKEGAEAASTGPQMKKAVTGGKHSKMDTSGKRGGGTGSTKFEAAPANSEEGSAEKIPNPPAVSSGNTKLKRSLGSKEVSYDANEKKHKGS